MSQWEVLACWDKEPIKSREITEEEDSTKAVKVEML